MSWQCSSDIIVSVSPKNMLKLAANEHVAYIHTAVVAAQSSVSNSRSRVHSLMISQRKKPPWRKRFPDRGGGAPAKFLFASVTQNYVVFALRVIWLGLSSSWKDWNDVCDDAKKKQETGLADADCGTPSHRVYINVALSLRAIASTYICWHLWELV